jgi:hypothetical protein
MNIPPVPPMPEKLIPLHKLFEEDTTEADLFKTYTDNVKNYAGLALQSLMMRSDESTDWCNADIAFMCKHAFRIANAMATTYEEQDMFDDD